MHKDLFSPTDSNLPVNSIKEEEMIPASVEACPYRKAKIIYGVRIPYAWDLPTTSVLHEYPLQLPLHGYKAGSRCWETPGHAIYYRELHSDEYNPIPVPLSNR